MHTTRWAQLTEEFSDLIEMTPDRRAERLREIRANDPELGADLDSLLSAHEHTGALDRPVDPLDLLADDSATGAGSEAARFGARPGERVGAYELLRRLGEGGMGSVWLAARADGAFKRSVALKLPHVAWIGDFEERMVRERDILAALEHPNIARFYDAGVDARGRPFMALEYVEGRAIDVYCRELKLSIRERLDLVLKVAKAVDFAHSKLIVHRDLKPGNILVTAQGEVRLLDFGIAKFVEGGSGTNAKATAFAGRLLTPDYASPEQIKGESVGTATDVYSLGVLTFELLTDARPYRLKRGSPAELEQAITEADPAWASVAAGDPARQRQLRGDLDVILNKAMKKNPADRYPTVDAFAGDLRRYLDGETVLAQPDQALYRLKKFVGRNRLGLTAAGIIALALISATAVSTWQAREARRQAEKATAMKDFLLRVFTAGDNRTPSSKPAGDVTAIELLDQGSAELMGSLQTQPEVKLELIQNMGDIYEGLDATDKAIGLYQQGVTLAGQSMGEHSCEKAGMLARIVGAYLQAGNWPAGDQWVPKAEAAFSACGDVTSENYAVLLKYKGNLQRRHGWAGLLAARETLRKSAAILEHYPKGEGYIGTMMYLAGTDVSLDQIPEAERAADAAVSAARNNMNDTSELANAVSMRASVEDELGDVAGAERDYLEASQLYAATVGKDHYLFVQNENFRGQLLHLTGRRDEGLRLMRATTDQVAVIRPASNTLGNCNIRLAEAYLRDGAYEDAFAAANAALKLEPIRQNNNLLSRVLLDRAEASVGLGSFAEAVSDVNRASTLTAAAGNPNDTGAAADRILASAALARGNLDEAETLIERAQSRSVGETRRMRRQRANVLSLQSRIALARGDKQTALASAAAARALATAPDLAGDPFLNADIATAESAALCAPGPSEDGLRVAEDALSIRRAIQRARSPLLAETEITAAHCASQIGRLDSARELLASAATALTSQPTLGPQFQRALAGATFPMLH